MAGIYPDINFPKIDFSILGNLPQTIEEAQGSASLKASLANLKDSSPDELDKAAARILSSPGLTTKNAEIALRLQEQARKSRETQALPGIYTALYSRLPGGSRGPDTGTGPLPVATGTATPEPTPPEPSPVVPGYNFGTNPLGPGGPGSSTGVTGLPGVPPPPVPTPSPAPPAPQPLIQGAAPSPSEEILARAQGAAPPVPAPGPQLAGPNVSIGQPSISVPGAPPAPPEPPGPNVTVGPSPGGGPGPVLPPWLQGAQMPAVAAQAPAAPPEPTPAEVMKALGSPPSNPTDPMLKERADKIFGMLNSLPRKTAGPAGQALLKAFDATLAQMNMSPEEKAWQRDRLDDWAAGRPLLSFRQYQQRKTLTTDIFKETEGQSKVYTDTAEKSRNLESDLSILNEIVKKPAFISGMGSENIAHMVSAGSGLRDLALHLGVPPGILETIGEKIGVGKNFEKLTGPTQLMEVFNAISNNAIYSKLGSLGSNISNSDRTFVQMAFPSLALTKAGNQLLIEASLAMTRRNIALGDMVDKLRHDKGLDLTAPELRIAVNKFRAESSIFIDKDGNRTDLGKRIDEAARMPPEKNPGPVTPTVPLPAPNPAAGPYLPAPGINTDLTGLPRGARDPNNPPPADFLVPDSQKPSNPPVPRTRGDINFYSRAGGGPVRAGQPYTVGEKGPETFVPTRPGMILPHHEGKVYYHEATGKPVGRIKNGRAVPFGQR